MNESENTILLTAHEDYEEVMKKFASHYNLMSVHFSFESNMKTLKSKAKRVCRFCGKDSSATKFKKVAHLMPEMIGNKGLFSDFECDTCNEYFGKEFENDLANYLGISRTLTRTKTKKKVSAFTAPGKAIKAKSESILDQETLVISRDDSSNRTINVDRENGIITLKIKKNPFRPVRVYKALLKIALSLIPEKEITKDYLASIYFLMNDNNINLNGCVVNGYILPLSLTYTPHAYLFRKKSLYDKVHTHVLALYFQNMIFALPVPLNRNDAFFYSSTVPITFPLYPPLFTQGINHKEMRIDRFDQDFSSEKPIKDLEDEIILKLNPDDLNEAVAHNTDQNVRIKTPFNPSEIIRLVMRNTDDPVDPMELIKILKQKGY